MLRHTSLFFLSLTISFSLISAVSDPLAPLQKPDEPKPVQSSKDETVQTTHDITINNKKFTYTATAAAMNLKNDKGEPTASIFYVSYRAENDNESIKRPITFCFNGGPGSASLWLHMGLLGPKRVKLSANGKTHPPYGVIENIYSLLDVTDLVFIDPVSTGFSRAIPPTEAKKFHGVKEDVQSIAEFIRLYLTQNNCWDAPKFIAGESYGTTRAAALAAHLHDEAFIYINGIVLISTVLNFQCIDFNKGNDLPYLLYLPSYTATAWYHKKLATDLQQNLVAAVEESRNFVQEEYVKALFKGNLQTKEEREKTIHNLSRLTGLSEAYIEQSDLRVNLYRFMKELLRDQKLTVGRFDSRFTGVDADSAGEYTEYDPSAEAVFGAFTAAANHYFLTDLKYKKDLEYKALTNVQPWDWDSENCYFDVSDSLRSTMTKNGNLRVFVANGYYDMATPFFETEYTFNHLRLNPLLWPHITMRYYEGGHMMYIDEPILKQMKADLKDYYEQTLKEQKDQESAFESINR